MALDGDRTYVGFGFGAIQAGLFLHEAFRSGSFRRLVVAEVVPDVVASVRRAGGDYRINVAHADGVETATVGPVDIVDPGDAAERDRLVEAIASATECGTAVPSVDFYVGESPGSVHRVLAEGLRRKAARGGPRAVVYAAENHNDAAGILRRAVLDAVPAAERDRVAAGVRFLDTVVGKMSGVITDAAEIRDGGLRTVTPDDPRAFLVEEFNRILIARIDFDGAHGVFRRGIEVFEEKDDLLPFEEAKLYGHNATHALAAYTGAVRGVARIADLRDLPGVRPFLRAAFIDESGAALVRRYHGVDPLFTWDGYRRYADDLLLRMTNPHLRDTVARVGRDAARKLGWDDRLVGTMRLALDHGLEPRRFAFGAAAALVTAKPELLDGGASIAVALEALWGGPPASPALHRARHAIVSRIAAGVERLRQWRASEFADLELLFHRDLKTEV